MPRFKNLRTPLVPNTTLKIMSWFIETKWLMQLTDQISMKNAEFAGNCQERYNSILNSFQHLIFYFFSLFIFRPFCISYWTFLRRKTSTLWSLFAKLIWNLDGRQLSFKLIEMVRKHCINHCFSLMGSLYEGLTLVDK